jgi:hypothetical protein
MIIVNIVQFCKRNERSLLKIIAGVEKKLLKEIHISESFMLALSALVTSVKLHVCQAKAFFGAVKCFQARHVIILPLHDHMLLK